MTNALKGHAMKRGTLMVLKRLMATTLGALGLGALLATGSALAQIPAPDDLAPPGAPDPGVVGCTAAMELDMAADDAVTDVTVCTDDMADAAQPVLDARTAQAAVDAAQTVVDSAEDSLDSAKEGTDQAAIATAQNAFDAANIRLDAAKAARDKLAADSSLAKAALDELNAIQMIEATETAQTTAEAVRNATGTSLAALEFDADGNNVNTGGTAIGDDDDTGSTLWGAYNNAVTAWEDLTDTSSEAAIATAAQNVVDTKHALNAAMDDAAYVALKATFDAQDAAAKAAATAHENADKAKAAAGKAIIAGLRGMPPAVAADDDTTARIARIVADLTTKRDAAVTDRDAKQALATEASNAKTTADTNLANANTRLANATAAYNTAAGAIGDGETRIDLEADELDALVAAEVEYAEAYFAQQAADTAAKNAKTANDGAQMALTAANTAVTAAQDALDNPAAHAFIFDPDNPAGDLTDALLSGEDTGGALVDAVDDLYQETEDNEDRLDALLAETETMVPVLDDDGNPVLDDDGNPMMEAATTESGRIVDIETSIAAFSGDDGTGGQVAQNSDAIAALTAEDDPATEDVDETGAVTKNAADIQDTNDIAVANEKMLANLTAEDDPATEDVDESGAITANTAGVAGNKYRLDHLTAEDDPATADVDETGAITANTNRSSQNSTDIEGLDGRVATNEDTLVDHGEKLAAKKEYIDNIGEELGLNAATGEGTGEGGMTRLDDIEGKLALKKEYIDNLGAEVGFNPATGEGTGEGGMSRIDANEAAIGQETTDRMAADTALGDRIDTEEAARMAADAAEATARAAADTALGGRIDTEEAARMAADTAEMTARMEADTMLGGRIDAEAEARASSDMMLHGMIGDEATARMGADAMLGGRIDTNASSISSNADAIAANMNSIGSNASAISDNRNMIGELSDDLDVVRAGVAASMALAGMPAINGRGISIGVGSFDGESAFAVGFQIQGEMASFKVGVTSASGATGASAGVGFQF